MLFSLCLLGTALTALRLWKFTHLHSAIRRSLPHLLTETMVVILLSGLETAVIPLCANMPALTALWRAGSSSSGDAGANQPQHDRRRRRPHLHCKRQRDMAAARWAGGCGGDAGQQAAALDGKRASLGAVVTASTASWEAPMPALTAPAAAVWCDGGRCRCGLVTASSGGASTESVVLGANRSSTASSPSLAKAGAAYSAMT